ARRASPLSYERQRQLLHLPRLGLRLPPASDQTPAHPTEPAAHERQSRTVHPNTATRMGIRRRLPNEHTPQPGAATVAALLQSAATPRQPRSPTTRKPPTNRGLTNVAGNYSYIRRARYSAYQPS